MPGGEGLSGPQTLVWFPSVGGKPGSLCYPGRGSCWGGTASSSVKSCVPGVNVALMLLFSEPWHLGHEAFDVLLRVA